MSTKVFQSLFPLERQNQNSELFQDFSALWKQEKPIDALS